MTATDELRAELTRRGVKWKRMRGHKHDGTEWHDASGAHVSAVQEYTWDGTEWPEGKLHVNRAPVCLTPAQAVEATLGREPWVNPAWERWHRSLRHDEIKSVGDAVEQLMYEAIEFGGDMGPNGNTYNGIDEGDVLTAGFINEWVAQFESTLGRDRYSYGQWREISNAVGDAMDYAHDRAIEHPDAADPLWNLDEYVNRILKVAFEGEATLGRGECHDTGESRVFRCSECGFGIEDAYVEDERAYPPEDFPRFCPWCGRKVVDE